MKILWDLIHNCIAHPLMFLTYWPYQFALWLHEESGILADYPEDRVDTNDPQAKHEPQAHDPADYSPQPQPEC
jgi:hypothetical protein